MKSTYETMGGQYQQNGDYLLPNLEVPESTEVGVWGERRRKYLRKNQKALYTAMMLSDTLNAHLEEGKRLHSHWPSGTRAPLPRVPETRQGPCPQPSYEVHTTIRSCWLPLPKAL